MGAHKPQGSPKIRPLIDIQEKAVIQQTSINMFNGRKSVGLGGTTGTVGASDWGTLVEYSHDMGHNFAQRVNLYSAGLRSQYQNINPSDSAITQSRWNPNTDTVYGMLANRHPGTSTATDRRLTLTMATEGGNHSSIFNFSPTDELGPPSSGFWGADRVQLYPFRNGDYILASQWSRRIGGLNAVIRDPTVFIHQGGNLLEQIDLPDLLPVFDINGAMESGLWTSFDLMLEDDDKGYAVIDTTINDGGEMLYEMSPDGAEHINTMPPETGRGRLGDLLIDRKRKIFYFQGDTENRDIATSSNKNYILYSPGGSFKEVPLNPLSQNTQSQKIVGSDWKKVGGGIVEDFDEFGITRMTESRGHGSAIDAGLSTAELSTQFDELGNFDSQIDSIARIYPNHTNRRVGRHVYITGKPFNT